MNQLIRLLAELRAIIAREEELADLERKPHDQGYRKGYRDAAEYAADGIEEALENLDG